MDISRFLPARDSPSFRWHGRVRSVKDVIQGKDEEIDSHLPPSIDYPSHAHTGCPVVAFGMAEKT